MTSPEKKRFVRRLFAHDAEITKMVNETLRKASIADKNVGQTIDHSLATVKKYDDEQANYKENIGTMIEKQVRSQEAKYKKLPNYCEPNLNRRMEQRRQRALERKQREEEAAKNGYIDISVPQSFKQKQHAKFVGLKTPQKNQMMSLVAS